jgi:hypothetical protein
VELAVTVAAVVVIQQPEQLELQTLAAELVEELRPVDLVL